MPVFVLMTKLAPDSMIRMPQRAHAPTPVQAWATGNPARRAASSRLVPRGTWTLRSAGRKRIWQSTTR